MIALPLAFALVSAEPQTDSSSASDAAEAAAAGAAAAHEAADVVAGIVAFQDHPEILSNSKLVDATIAAEHKWHVCVSGKVDRWRGLDEPTMTILDAAFNECAFESAEARMTYVTAFSSYYSASSFDFASAAMKRAEERLRLDLTAAILEAKAARQR